jgi:hypothetical protein
MAQLPIAEADICIFQGATLNQTLFYETGDPSTPVNLAGQTAKMHIRSKPESKAIILELSTTNGRIILNESTGSIRLFISATDTANLSVCDNPNPARQCYHFTRGYPLNEQDLYPNPIQ